MDLNIRNVDPSLVASLKSEAALLGTTLRNYVEVIFIARVKPGGTDGTVRGNSGDQRESDAGDAGGRGTDGSSVPVLPKTKVAAKRLHPVPAVRTELASGGGHEPEPSSFEGTVSVKCTKPGHIVFKNGDGWYCMTCNKEK